MAAATARSWLRAAGRLAVVVCLTCIAATALLLVLERRLIYYPTRAPLSMWQPADLGVEECTFRTRDGLTLHGWWHPGRGAAAAARPVLLWCHGNAGNITDRRENLRMLAEAGLAALIFDYRGYGKSEGTPSEAGLYADVEAACDYLTKERGIPPGRIVVFGRSLGAAVALHTALHRDVAGLVMESAFESAPAMARLRLPFPPAWLFMRTRFDNRARVADLAVPLLVMHGDRDTLIPISQGRAVFEAAPEPKQFHVIRGAGHNDTYLAGGREYFGVLARFCRDCVGVPSGGRPDG